MASLPKIPFTDIDDTRVAVDAPVSTDLMTDIVVNGNYLKAVVTDGATAPQGIVASDIEVTGDLLVDGNADFEVDVNIDGVLSVGVFFSSEQIYVLMLI